MTTFKELRSILNEIESLSARCKAAGLCLRSLLKDVDDKPKQSTAKAASDFPGKLNTRHRPYRWSAAQKNWVKAQYKAGKTAVDIAEELGTSPLTVGNLLRLLGVLSSNKKRASARVSVSEAVLGLIQAHAAKGKIARTDLRRHAAKQRLTPYQVGQALRLLDDAKKVVVDGDLITVQ
jgi:hypothetical protein